MIEIDTWEKCYPSAWKGIITPESFSHPAKFSSRLIERIYQHGIECGWLHEGSRVIDPFGGVGLGAWPALRFGMSWSGVELESRFVDLAQANIDAWNAKYSGRLARWGTARILQGDSRHLAQVIGAAEACISSPPFNEDKANVIYGQTKGFHSYDANEAKNRMKRDYVLPSTPGNLGNLPPGDVDAVISSPPYAETEITQRRNFLGPHSPNAQLANAPQDERMNGYSSTPGQLAALPPGAPPFEGCISSPPFEASDMRKGGSNLAVDKAIRTGRNPNSASVQACASLEPYGSSSGQLGNDSGETFWSAAREIVAQVYQVLAPGAHAIWVVKHYVKNKALVPFPAQWQTLCESVGFVTLHEHHALLVRHGATSIDIDGNHHKHKTESKSFFRRLAEKNGSPRIDFETVLCLVKPGGEGGGWDGAISSPPYIDSDISRTQSQGTSRIDPTSPNYRPSAVEKHTRLESPVGYGTTPGQLGSLPPGSLDDATRHGG